ncbi:uncharacterized protein TrAFT101_010344 [Trichoderma asperellum]|uniref:Uncharacterized protein n=1 Tax=Trichoderma asperellum (strain ATCC 204424 / CBS 433.97 / NBRC 101777) TaxID=1042311 RepID=A0A2T3YV82_TRIA4|nr:hypothetical protein M441DRAFT_73265 [Trichoderma asperellum CBS 433.97]PTB36459.1 hypothetical protein M441DRAFT_73265 [Trichoderma asperellum CBS 433.97]UKZ95508.1 hypothetical protein TrAFT101_010344 [Trichoderma asperellum]
MDRAGVAVQSTPSGCPWGLSLCLQAQGAYRVCPTCEQAERPKLERPGAAAQDFDFDSSLWWTQNANHLRDKPHTRACIVSCTTTTSPLVSDSPGRQPGGTSAPLAAIPSVRGWLNTIDAGLIVYYVGLQRWQGNESRPVLAAQLSRQSE